MMLAVELRRPQLEAVDSTLFQQQRSVALETVAEPGRTQAVAEQSQELVPG